MNRQVIRWLLKGYPSKWRVEYGSELADLLGEHPLRLGVLFDVLWSALKERVRQPLVAALLGNGLVFFLAILFSHPLWHFLSAPVGPILRSQGFKPPNLVALRPWEQFEVIYLGMPLLVTTSIAYPCAVLLAWRAFTNTARAFAFWSATLYILGFFAGAFAWQNGSIAMLLHIMPDLQNAPVVSVGHCFNLLAVSTLGLALLLQLPFVTFHNINGVIRKMHRTGRSKHP